MARRFVTGLSPMKNKLQADWMSGTVAANMIHEQVDRGLAAAAEMILKEIR